MSPDATESTAAPAAPASTRDGLAGRHLVLGLSGGVACYKSAELARELIRAGATVQVVMTEAAERFITPLTMQALTNRSVCTSQWDPREPNAMAHINLTREADAVLVAPASADFIAQLAQGRAGELLPLLCVARPRGRCALVVAPAMNREMWSHPATQRNVAQVVADGTLVLGPGSGDQACGEVGDGRMLEPADIVARLDAHFRPKLLVGGRVVVTAGPTFEPIDPVRGLTNRSSGKMGFAIARAAAEAGAEVTLVAGPCALATPPGVRRVDVTTAREMCDATLALVRGAHVFVATAAVADWRPAEIAAGKIKKQPGEGPPPLALVENPDVLAEVARLPDAPYCVGFAAESDRLVEHAQAKLAKKGIPLVVANIGADTFGRDENQVTLVDAEGAVEWPAADKLTLARRLVAEIARRIRG